MGSLRVLRARLADQSGVTVIETVISAAILIMVVSAVLTTIDVGGRTVAVNKSRTVAAALAEQDQERMRAMTAARLDGFTDIQDVPVGGAEYKVKSESEWIYDATDSTKSCENGRPGAPSYIRISTTVTSGALGTRVKPVVMRGIVAQRVEDGRGELGTLTVLVYDERGNPDGPVANLPVSISGPSAHTGPTNEFGCVTFARIPAGSYTVTLNTAGYIDEQRQQLTTKTATVVPDENTTVEMAYARPAAITVRFDSLVPPNPAFATGAVAATVVNARSGPIPVRAPAFPALASAITVPTLFPYPSGYTAYAGECAVNDPAGYDANYFTNGGSGRATVTPGATTSVTTRTPALNVRVTDSADAPISGATVVFTPQGCTAPAKYTRTTTTGGVLADPSLPFGDYDVCASAKVTSSGVSSPIGTVRRRTIASVENRTAAGTAPQAITFQTSGNTDGACP